MEYSNGGDTSFPNRGRTPSNEGHRAGVATLCKLNEILAIIRQTVVNVQQ